MKSTRNQQPGQNVTIDGEYKAVDGEPGKSRPIDPDKHLPKWARLVIRATESPVVITVTGLLFALIAFGPIYWLGVWWAVGVVACGVSFALGWDAARRKWMKDGYVPKI